MLSLLCRYGACRRGDTGRPASPASDRVPIRRRGIFEHLVRPHRRRRCEAERPAVLWVTRQYALASHAADLSLPTTQFTSMARSARSFPSETQSTSACSCWSVSSFDTRTTLLASTRGHSGTRCLIRDTRVTQLTLPGLQHGPQRLHSAAAHERPARRRSPRHVLAAQRAEAATAG